jgi:biopolymer transport protein ExbB
MARRSESGRGVVVVAIVLTLLLTCCWPATGYAQDAPADAQTPAIDKGPPVFIYILRSVGIVFGVILLAVSMWMVALCVLLALDLKMSGAIPVGFVEEFSDTVNKRKFKEAYDLAKADPSFLGRVLTAGMARLQYGLEDAREAAGNMVESIRIDKEQKNNYLAVIGTLGPLLGLVGTVFGMILAFRTMSGGEGKNAAQLADDIGHALSITLIGVAISCPSIALNVFFRNRINKITLDVAHIADDLLTQMYHNSKKPAPPAVPTPSGTQAVPTK